MSSGLTEEKLRQVVAEVDRMVQERQKNLNRDEVKQVLEELNLPPDMLDEALLRIHYRDAIERSEQTDRSLWVGLAAVAAVAIGGGLVWLYQHQMALSRVTAVQDRLTLAQDQGNLVTIDRQRTPEVFYRVTLNQAPVGDRLSLNCQWVDPAGVTVHQNQYHTQKITTPIWQTHCRLPLHPDAAPGTWQVEMRLGDRVLEQAQFQVR